MKYKKSIILISLITFCFINLFAQSGVDTLTYSKNEVLITMRDGIKLNTIIYAPKNAKEPVPFLFHRTPYGISEFPSPDNNLFIEDLAKDGYIFVYQDIRGRYKSEGIFEMLRFTRDKNIAGSIDESTDTYDAIDWLIKNIPNNNGKVGMFGTSYGGWTTMMGTLDPHPSLKAACEMATSSDMFIGDDFFHNGAFRLSYAFEYTFMEEYSRNDTLFPFNEYDTYEWYLDLGPLSNVNTTYFHSKLPTWNNFTQHPNYDDFWKQQSLTYRLDAPSIPILHVAGWWDQEDFYGPLKAYEVLEKKDSHNTNYIIIGPWNHGGWHANTGESLGNISFKSPTAQIFRTNFLAPFFSYFLKGKGNENFSEAIAFQTGSNEWKTYDEWPPTSITTTRNLYINKNGRLTFDAPIEDEAFDEYLSDPAYPVPYRPRPIEETYGPGSRWYTWLLTDQRFVDNRPDVISWETDELEYDLIITGNILADIYASTTGSDADWIVKLIDVYPGVFPEDPKMGGYQLMIANDVFRGRFRNSYSEPEPMTPNEVFEFRIDLHSMNHVFKAGHKIMVQIQSTWFPIIDRNPQKFVPNIFEAKESDFIKAYQRIHRSYKFSSHIKIPIVEN